MSIKKYLQLIFLSFVLSLSGWVSVINLTDPYDKFGNLNRVAFFLSLSIWLISFFTLIFYFFSINKNKTAKKKYFDILERSIKKSAVWSSAIVVFLALKMVHVLSGPITIVISVLIIVFGEILTKIKIGK